MPRVGRWALRLGIVLAAAVAGLFALGPREPVDPVPVFDAGRLPDDLGAYLAAREDVVGGITPGVEKRILWAGPRGAVTEWAVVYLHGFSATSEEIRPVPDNVAQALGANLYFTRFAGHGLGPDRFAGPTINDWMVDVAEALAIGRRIGRRVLVIATSTGGTLAAEAALQPDLAGQIDAIVLVAPNFGIRAAAAALLTWPLARHWAPVVAGAERCFEPLSERQARYWTTCYPTVALLPMAAIVKHAAGADYSGTTVPALFIFSPDDQVVSAGATETVMARWGGPAEAARVRVGPRDDPLSHVIAGDVMSPDQTGPVTARILGWLSGL